MNPQTRSALTAGVIAGVVYTLIATVTGTSFGAAIGVGLIYLVATTVVAFVLILIIRKVLADRRT